MISVREIENLWIPLSDGVRLAARVWMPADAESSPVPAVLEYLPYRKRDFTRSRDEPIHRYFAENGYVSVRVDIRGSGDSDGHLTDEYCRAEHDDALEVIDWLSRQPWCSGSVGMFGISWGGFNGMQVAARRPRALKAIMTLCAADDRYADDAHYMGGCLLNENLQWGAVLMLNQALPPDPALVGDNWRASWQRRLDDLPAFPIQWMRHPWRDAHWQHGSISEDYSAIECAVYAIGGWADGYSNAVMRLIEKLDCPKKGLIGPWAHNFPHDARPGPSIGFLQEAVRWWDQWLKEDESGVMDDPALQVWLQESVEPQPQYDQIPGRWVAFDQWPPAANPPLRFYLDRNDLVLAPGRSDDLAIQSPATAGLRGGEWCGFGVDGEMPRDQRPDDGFSLCFDSDVLDQDLSLLGTPTFRFRFQSDHRQAQICVRLCDVAATGQSLRVSYGLLNLTHYNSHEIPEPLEPGRWYTATLQLNDCAHVFPAGHRVRLALSNNYWPIAWPSPALGRLLIRTADCQLDLPEHHRSSESRLAPQTFSEPVAAAAEQTKKILHQPFKRSLHVDLTTTETVLDLAAAEFGETARVYLPAIDLSIGHTLAKQYRIVETDASSAETRVTQTADLKRGDWSIHLELVHRMTSDEENFFIEIDLTAMHGENEVASRKWRETVRRELV